MPLYSAVIKDNDTAPLLLGWRSSTSAFTRRCVRIPIEGSQMSVFRALLGWFLGSTLASVISCTHEQSSNTEPQEGMPAPAHKLCSDATDRTHIALAQETNVPLDHASMNEEQRLKAGLMYFAMYPPPQWGSHRLEVFRKSAILHATSFTPQEYEFAHIYDLWEIARIHLERTRATSVPSPIPGKN